MLPDDRPITLFYSYAHADETLRKELEKHLSLLKNQGYIQECYDRRIEAGQEWEDQIDQHLETAQLILLLISPDFMASNYCYSIELKRAMARHEAGEARVVPIILRPVDWQSAPFGKLQTLPKDARAVVIWPNQDEAFTDVAQEIRRIVRPIENIEENIESLITQIGRLGEPIHLAEPGLRQLRDDYLSYLKELCQPLDFKGIRLPEAVEKTVGLPLGDIYIPIRIQDAIPSAETWQRIAGRGQKNDILKVMASREQACQKTSINFETCIDEIQALVILGDPGAGKSTLLKYLTLRLAAADSKILPILIPLSTYSKALQENTSLSLTEFMPRYFAGRQTRLKNLGLLFQAALAQGKAVVLLDGLDEVVVERERVVALVDDFVREYVPPKPSTSGSSALLIAINEEKRVNCG